MYEYKLVTETLSTTKAFSYLINSVIRNQVLPLLTLDCFFVKTGDKIANYSTHCIENMYDY